MNMYGIVGIRVKFFVCKDKDDTKELNDFLYKCDGNIVDIQYQQSNFAAKQVMVVYVDDSL